MFHYESWKARLSLYWAGLVMGTETILSISKRKFNTENWLHGYWEDLSIGKNEACVGIREDIFSTITG